MQLSEIWVYPVKSCRGIRVDQARVVGTGLEHDRMWMVIDETGRFVTQREEPRLATLETAIEVSCVRLTHPAHGSVALEVLPGTPADREVRVWEHRGLAHDAGDEAAAWLSDLLGRRLRLVRMPDDQHRAVGPAYAGTARTAFSDGYPILAISTASLAGLCARLADPVPMDRFRPNLVIDDAPLHAEDTWTNVRIGEVDFVAVAPCPRCVVTTVDQRTGEAGHEPLRTLAGYRRREGGVMFGQNLVHVAEGRVRVGDRVLA